jgi:orotate phosphoribosyltransferase-like protein
MTATRHTGEGLVLPIARLHRHGLSSRAIAHALDMSRNTVRRLLAAYAARETEHHALVQCTSQALGKDVA